MEPIDRGPSPYNARPWDMEDARKSGVVPYTPPKNSKWFILRKKRKIFQRSRSLWEGTDAHTDAHYTRTYTHTVERRKLDLLPAAKGRPTLIRAAHCVYFQAKTRMQFLRMPAQAGSEMGSREV